MFRIQGAAEWDFSVWRFPALKRRLPIFLEYWSQCQYQNSAAKFGPKKSNDVYNELSLPKCICIPFFCHSHTRPLTCANFCIVVMDHFLEVANHQLTM